MRLSRSLRTHAALLAAPLAAVLSAAGAAPLHAAATVKTLYALAGSDDGKTPLSPMVQLGPFLYGTTVDGGRYYSGTLFRLNPATGKSVTVYSFTGGADGGAPRGAIATAGGKLYGVASTSSNGHGPGTVYRIDPASGTETTLYTFTGNGDGGNPKGGLLNDAGTLYGTTFGIGTTGYGTVFKINPVSGAFKTLHAFTGGADSGHPAAALIASAGALYGTTSGFALDPGTVFKLDPLTGAETVLYAFTGGADGGNPESPLLASGGYFYGTALSGGATGGGTVYKINSANNAETTLYTFKGGADGQGPYAGLIANGGLLYGVSSAQFIYGGAIFSIDPMSGAENTLYTFPQSQSPNTPGGNNPAAGLIAISNTLYGTTSYGGTANGGTSFAFSTTARTQTTLHNFVGASQGAYTPGTPVGQYAEPGLLNISGILYGTDPYDGSSGLGSVFKYDPAAGTATTLHSFTGGTHGFRPQASLASAAGSLYGTTYGADLAAGTGTVFETNPATGATHTLYDFENGGANPASPLFKFGTLLYGASTGDTFSASGSIYTINHVTRAFKTLQSDNCRFNGLCSYGGFAAAGGLVYGTTYGGGTYGQGTIFSINPATAAITTVYNFTGGNDGGVPSGSLLKFGTRIYGTTRSGGSGGNGVVFAFDPATGLAAGLHAFQGSDGAAPSAGLINIGTMLYGTTQRGGASGNGTLFRIGQTGLNEATLYSFNGGADGGSPQAPLTAVSGTLYGTTTAGGANNRGTIFSFVP